MQINALEKFLNLRMSSDSPYVVAVSFVCLAASNYKKDREIKQVFFKWKHFFYFFVDIEELINYNFRLNAR